MKRIQGSSCTGLIGASSTFKPPTSSRKPQPSRARRGVVLLIVLSLLSMFLLVALTFVVASAHARRTAKSAVRIEQVGDDPRNLLDQAFRQLVRGSTLPGSAIGPHSLLEDVYSASTFEGEIAATPAPAALGGGQMLTFGVTSAALEPSSGYYNGHLLTMLTGVAAGRSARITGYSYDTATSTGTFRIMNFSPPIANTDFATGDRFIINSRPFSGPGVGYNPANWATPPTEIPLLDASIDSLAPDNPGVTLDPPWELALLPNPRHPLHQIYLKAGPDLAMNSLLPPTDPINIDNGYYFANEDYDAPDFQNMFLAYQVPGATGALPAGYVPLPSFHRPDLIWYWANRTDNNLTPPNDYVWAHPDMGPELRRRIILRPLPEDHTNDPSFSIGDPYVDSNRNGVYDPGEPFVDLDPSGAAGYTPGSLTPDFTGKIFDPINGPWDVDNDGDGIADSIWIDIGLGVQRTRDGRTYKPLVAILCLDLDGRLNLNAHGSVEQLTTDFNTDVTGFYAGGADLAPMVRGEGYGAAEVGLGGVIADPADLQQLLFGTVDVPGRYGDVHETNPLNRRPGKIEDPAVAGQTNDDNVPVAVMSEVDTQSFEGDVHYYSNMFSSPAGPHGSITVGLDTRGQPVYRRFPIPLNVPAAPTSEARNDPYQLMLGHLFRAGRAAGTNVYDVDVPYRATELEAVLRWRDVDAPLLPSRLTTLAPNTLGSAGSPELRRLVTTDSWDIPGPSFIPTPEIQNGLAEYYAALTPPQPVPPVTSMLQLLRGKVWAVNGGPTPAAVDHIVNSLIGEPFEDTNGDGYWDASEPYTDLNGNGTWDSFDIDAAIAPELLAGVRMDLNRVFGNNADDNGNEVADDPAEAAGTELLWVNNYLNAAGFEADNNGDGFADDRDLRVRYRMAKHLFILAMLLMDDDYFDAWSDPTIPALPAGQVERKELTIRRIAQWAVNVVDYRDADAIMTPFEYDKNPFTIDDPANGTSWEVDGDLTTGSGDAWRRVVWGVEYPDLILTETLAFHDRRSEDLETPSEKVAPDGTDPNFDQRRIPRGAAFVELYCTRNPNNPNPHRELYREVDGVEYLDLGRMAGDSPVWRLAISGPTSNPENNMAQRIITKPDLTTFDPENSEIEVPGLPVGDDPVIERIVWFGTTPPAATHPDLNRTYYNTAGAAGAPVLLAPGGYALIGPHREPTSGPINISNVGYSTTSVQEVHLGTTQYQIGATPTVTTGGFVNVEVKDLSGSAYPDTPLTAGAGNPIEIQTPIGIPVAAAVPPAGWPAAAGPIGFSISEPVPGVDAYYPAPDTPGLSLTLQDGAGDVVYQDTYSTPDDQPFDETSNVENVPPGYGTTLNHKTVFLQRLADPTQPHDSVTNPYITIDWMPFDLTVFNGEEKSGVVDPVNAEGTYYFRSRQRGRTRIAGTSDFNIWRQPDYIAENTLEPENGDPMQAPNDLEHTLGYLNIHFHNTAGGDPYWHSDDLASTYTNAEADPDIAVKSAARAGDPLTPFPWLTWPNRPFTSALEILSVPASSQSRLLWELDDRVPHTGNPWYPEGATGTGAYNEPRAPGWPFAHLLNYWHSASARSNNDPDGASETTVTSDLYRLLEYVHVPSRFSGSEVFLNPQEFNRLAADPMRSLAPFYAPFNRISTYREPGRLNLNTIADARVWAGVSGMLPMPLPFNDLVESRRGSGITSDPFELSANPSVPTVFANPFRSLGSTYQVPIDALRERAGTQRNLVEAGLLRPEDGDEPLFDSHTANAYDSADANPYFAHRSYQKLGNVVTSRSNVYAIWITLGFFEVEQVPVTPARPDGWRLVRELGVDTGEIKRHRAFYIYDRSIPVGFRRGDDLNIHEGILVERFIE